MQKVCSLSSRCEMPSPPVRQTAVSLTYANQWVTVVSGYLS
jgi:hypothetical protein